MGAEALAAAMAARCQSTEQAGRVRRQRVAMRRRGPLVPLMMAESQPLMPRPLARAVRPRPRIMMARMMAVP